MNLKAGYQRPGRCECVVAATGDISAGVGLYEVLCVMVQALDKGMQQRMGGGHGMQPHAARLPREWTFSTVRHADKRGRQQQPRRRKPLEGGGRGEL